MSNLRKELIRKVAQKHGVTNKAAEEIIMQAFKFVANTISNDKYQHFRMRYFGMFKCKKGYACLECKQIKKYCKCNGEQGILPSEGDTETESIVN